MALAGRQGRPRLGCLGGIALLLVVGPVLFLLIDAVFAPWAFVMGGHFHPLPYWQGWGVLHARPAGDFVVLVRMWPTPGSRNGYSAVTGTAELCAPRGERFSLQLSGEFVRKHVWLHPDGEPMYLHLYRRPWYYSFVTVDRRPRLDLHGPWRGPDLVMDDHGTLSRAFLPDGRLFPGPPGDQPAARGSAKVTLREGSHADFDAACRAAAR